MFVDGSDRPTTNSPHMRSWTAVWKERDSFLSVFTNQAPLAAEEPGRKVIVCYSNLNTNEANLASEAFGPISSGHFDDLTF